MPRRRKCSIERALVLLHLGCCAVSSLSVTRMVGHGTPGELDRRRQADRSAADHQRKRLSVHRVILRSDRSRGTSRRASQNSPPWRRPSWSMPWPMPCDRCHSTGTPSAASPLDGLEQRLRRDQVVLVAVHQQHRRPRLDLGGERFRIGVGRDHQQPGIADDRERRGRRAAVRHAAPSWCPG